ncbi:MAG: DUF5317 family protein [Anaerocolumna sp.]
MLLYILFAFICSKIKGYRLIPVFKAYSLYPYAVAELIYLFLQASIFMHNYSFIRYTAIINSFYMYTLIIPIMVYKLYKPGITGSLFILAGTLLNKFVMNQNGGRMPVYATLSKLTGYYNETAIQSADTIHIIGNEAVKFKFLTDYIDIGTSILSIGDVLIHSFIFIVIYYTIKEINIKPNHIKTEKGI